MTPTYDPFLGELRKSDLAEVGSPVNAVAAAKVLTVSDIPAIDDTVTIGVKTYKFVEALVAANDILIGITAEACIDNLVSAVNATAGAGVTYGTGTTINATVTATKASAATVLAAAKVKGAAGNAIVIAKVGTNLAWAGGANILGGGVDGTVGVLGQRMYDSAYEYLCTDVNTIAESKWLRVAIGLTF